MNITCDDRERIFLDGSPEEWAALEQHAVTCAACAEQLRGWKQLSIAAVELRDYWESPVLWSKIETSLREQQTAVAARRRWSGFLDFGRLLSHSWQMALAGAMVVALAVAAGYLYNHRTASPTQDASNKLLKSRALAEVERTERDYMAAIDKLAAEASPQLSSDTPLMASYREKLLVLDTAIADLRAQAGENPSNAHLRYQLLAMYEEKQQTLEDVLESKR
jgi:hypothetical protein